MEADKLSDRVAFMNAGHIAAMDTPLRLKQQHGKRSLKALVGGQDGNLAEKEILLDTPDTPRAVQALFASENVVTVRSGEATLEDIFIKLTGRSLA